MRFYLLFFFCVAFFTESLADFIPFAGGPTRSYSPLFFRIENPDDFPGYRFVWRTDSYQDTMFHFIEPDTAYGSCEGREVYTLFLVSTDTVLPFDTIGDRFQNETVVYQIDAADSSGVFYRKTRMPAKELHFYCPQPDEKSSSFRTVYSTVKYVLIGLASTAFLLAFVLFIVRLAKRPPAGKR